MKKSIITIVILVLLLFLLNWWTGTIISSRIDDQLSGVLAGGQAGALTYSGNTVSPLLSQVTISRLSYRNGQNHEFRAESIRASFTYRDFFKLLTGNTSEVFRELSYLSLYFNNSAWIDHDNSSETTLDDGFFTLRGDITGGLVRLMQKRLPSATMSLDVEMYELQDRDLNISQSFLPGFRDNNEFDFIEKFSGNFEYDPVRDRVNMTDVQLLAPFAELALDGLAQYRAGEWSYYPRELTISYVLSARPEETRFTVSRSLGQIQVNGISLNSSASINMDNFFQAPAKNLFFSEGKTGFSLDRVHFHPSQDFIQEYGMMFQAFGLNTDAINFRRITGNYTLENDRLILYGTEIETSFFEAYLNIDVTFNESGEEEATINEGSLRISKMTAGIEEFFENIEMLFSTELPRDDGDILIHFRGPLTSPEIIE
ncbi:MAG: hypothetical protein WDZ53_08535 [Balneolales bacterium]